jgi:hypothetical protein
MPVEVHETASNPSLKPPMSAGFVQVGVAANGLEELLTCPPETTTHDVVEEQAAAVGPSAPKAELSKGVVLDAHAVASPVGSLVLMTPSRSSAKQADADGQVTDSRNAFGSVRTVHVGLALPGSTDVAICLDPLTATHSDVVGHDTPPPPIVGLKGIRRLTHAPAGPVGSLVVQMSPVGEIATHRDADGHDTLFSNALASTRTRCHALGTVGVVEVSIDPWSPTPTHSSVDGQDTLESGDG